MLQSRDRLIESLWPVYDQALEALMAGVSRFAVDQEPEEVNRVLLAVLTDHPELFWFDGRWTLIREWDQMYVSPCYLMQSASRDAAREQIGYVVSQARQLRELPPPLRVREIYDGLLRNVSYGMGDTRGQTVFDVFINGQALCKGLSKAFQLLLTEAGIQATLAEGTLDGKARHIWNLIELDGKLFHSDVSLGYPRFSQLFGGLRQFDPRRFLLVSEEEIRKTHQIYERR